MLIDFNKGNGIARPVQVFSIEDYFFYYYCVKKLENKLAINRVKNTYGGWSLDGRFRKSENDSDSTAVESDDSLTPGLNPAAFALVYGEYNSQIKRELESCPDDVKIIEIDIANFYDTIRVDILENKIRSATTKSQSKIVDMLFYFLANSSKLIYSYKPQSTGIPQDKVGDCSRILANFYLQDYDKHVSNYAKKHNIKYLRFADDQLLICPSNINTDVVCREISKLLYQIGLNINQKKVRIWNKENLKEYRCIDLFSIIDTRFEMKDQTEEVCQKFAQKTLELIKKDKDRRTKFEIKSHGLPLIKKMLSLNINKISPELRKEYLNLVYKDNYLQYFTDYNLTKLYKSLNENEKTDFLKNLNEIVNVSVHASFPYEVLKFKRKLNLETHREAIKLKSITQEWKNK